MKKLHRWSPEIEVETEEKRLNDTEDRVRRCETNQSSRRREYVKGDENYN